MSLLEKAKQFAINAHNDTNHTYDGKPYEVHLNKADEVSDRFIHLIPENKREIVKSAIWCHDTIEDTRHTFNDVKKKLDNSEVAEIVYAVTNEKGRNRDERQSPKYYQGIKNTPFATFVKLCDRIANMEYSKESGSSMFDKYVKEYPDFKAKLYVPDYNEMYKYLDKLSGYSRRIDE